MADQEVSYNSIIEYKPSGSFVELGEVIDWDGPNRDRKTINISALRDANVRKKLGRGDSGQLKLTIGFKPDGSNYAIFVGLWTANTATDFRLSTAGAVTETFSGLVKSVSPKGPDDDRVSFMVTIEIDGASTAATP